jgi:hypothetical protein
MALVMLTPGLVPTESEAGGTESVNFVANGTRNSTAAVVLDGAAISGIEQNSSITELKYTPSVDVIEEFKVQTNYFSAEFGNTGGAIVNMVSKSGTNELHGVGYEFHRNSALNANDFFSNREGQPLPDFKLQAQCLWRHHGRAASRPETVQREESDVLLYGLRRAADGERRNASDHRADTITVDRRLLADLPL